MIRVLTASGYEIIIDRRFRTLHELKSYIISHIEKDGHDVRGMETRMELLSGDIIITNVPSMECRTLTIVVMESSFYEYVYEERLKDEEDLGKGKYWPSCGTATRTLDGRGEYSYNLSLK